MKTTRECFQQGTNHGFETLLYEQRRSFAYLAQLILGISPSKEDSQWFEEYTRGSTEMQLSPSAAESPTISRSTNVSSKPTSLEFVEMLSKSVGKEEPILAQTNNKALDTYDEMDCLIEQMEPNLKKDSNISVTVGDCVLEVHYQSELDGHEVLLVDVEGHTTVEKHGVELSLLSTNDNQASQDEVDGSCSGYGADSSHLPKDDLQNDLCCATPVTGHRSCLVSCKTINENVETMGSIKAELVYWDCEVAYTDKKGVFVVSNVGAAAVHTYAYALGVSLSLSTTLILQLAAGAINSKFVSVSKACDNDVWRLTFRLFWWLEND